jgi:hypothetical protein
MSKPTPQQLAILAEHPNAALHFGGKRPVKKKSRPTVFDRGGFSTIGERANYWCEGADDWWKWEGNSETDIIAYIPDPDYPQPPVESLSQYCPNCEAAATARPTRQDARDMLADAFAAMDFFQIGEDIRKGGGGSRLSFKAIIDAIAGEE